MGEREPRRHGSWGEVGGEGSLRCRHPGRDPGRPDPQAEPPSRAFGLGHESGPHPPGSPRRSCPGASGGGGGCWTEPGAAGKGSGRLEHPPLPAAVLLPLPRGPRSPRPAGRRAGEEENQPTEGAPQFPRASGTRARACRPGDNGREGGKKGLRNLAEELNGVERRGEGLGRGRLGGGGRSAAAGGRAGGERGAQSQPRRHCSRAPNSGGGGGGGGGGGAAAAAEAEGRPGPALARAPARGLAAAAAPGSAADRREELAGAPREDGAAGRLRGVSWPEPRRSEPRRPRVSGGRGRGARTSGRRRRKWPGARPAAALALAGRASGGVGAAGGPRCGAAGADADGGVGSAEGDGFRANPASPAGSEPARELGGPGQRGRQVVELARGLTGAFLAVLGRGREGGRRVAPDPGRGRAPARLSPSARSPGRFSSRRSQSCCPGRPGRRRAQLPPPLARVPPCSELAGSRTGESG